jgi:organic radical activating enzyme
MPEKVRRSIVSGNPKLAREAAPGEGFVSEMFCSLQGEGPFVGERQVFLRTAGCTATCWWCDTVYSKVETPRFVIHDADRRVLSNPLGVDAVLAEVHGFVRANDPVRTVSITGGEPLEQPEFTRALARGIKETGLRVYLETNGVHAPALSAMLEWVDVIAMDIKLPGAIGTEAWDAHAAFLDVLAGTRFDPGSDAAARERLFVKVVVDTRSTVEEVERAAATVGAFSRRVPLILQPESGALLSERVPRETAARLMEKLGEAQRRALARVEDVRVMPQCHKILNIR